MDESKKAKLKGQLRHLMTVIAGILAAKIGLEASDTASFVQAFSDFATEGSIALGLYIVASVWSWMDPSKS